MEIIVISDSHRSTSKFSKILDRHPHIEYLIHLGDFTSDLQVIHHLKPTLLTEAVHGNCDRQRLFPSENLLQLVGKRIFITHGHEYGVKSSFGSLLAKGRKEKADAILFGHTHEAMVTMREGIWMINPGSISLPRNTNRGTYAVLELTQETLNARIVEI